ncbi:MAG: hypothetical protein ACK4FV_00725 [Candidatus Nitrosocaldus sp.]
MKRVERMVCNRAVKLHIFMPSSRRIWTVVGRKHEYWVHPPHFCTCKDYYFRARAVAVEGNEEKEEEKKEEEKVTCYHLKAVAMAEGSGMVDEVHFHDDEYDGFIRVLIEMIYGGVTNS